MNEYVMAALVSDTDELIDWRIVRAPDETNDLVARLPKGMRALEQARTPARSHAEAYSILLYALATEQSPGADKFWQRVRYVPRIRVAAIRHMGMRALGPVMRSILL